MSLEWAVNVMGVTETLHRLFLFNIWLHLTPSELWFGQEQEGILPQLLSSSFIV